MTTAGMGISTITAGATATAMAIAAVAIATGSTPTAVGIAPIVGDIANVVCTDVSHGAIEPADGNRFAAVE
jgi:cobalamin biosynthesis protein CbiD